MHSLSTSERGDQGEIVWLSTGRRAEMKKMSDPSTLAPEIFAEVFTSLMIVLSWG